MLAYADDTVVMGETREGRYRTEKLFKASMSMGLCIKTKIKQISRVNDDVEE